MPRPRATYRLQMGEEMTFAHARELVPYLARLGISHLYLSPIWRARSGSTHGYDVVDPNALDPRIGSRTELGSLAKHAHDNGMGLICDVVPNHMAASHENPWWWDVLEHGPRSRFAHLFDIDWEAGGGRLVLPLLADEPERVLADLVLERTLGRPRLRYHDHRFPVTADADRVTADLLDAQPYRLAYWRTGASEVNYRRFFDITDLVATRMDDPSTVALTHELVVDLLREKTIDGLRIDHVDGLRDPGGYLDTLGGLVPDDTYVVVEKILAPDERLPSWTTHGTTGYELADAIETAGVDRSGARELRAFTAELTGSTSSFRTVSRRSKREALETLFPSELDGLTRRIAKLGNVPPERVRRGLVQATSALDVYRTYVTSQRTGAVDRDRIERALTAVTDTAVRTLLSEVFLVRGPRGSRIADRLDAVARWQHLSAPAAAKGVEDTAFYRDVTLLSRNDVGGEPARPSTTVDALHGFLADRRRSWPSAMGSTSTHDSKRGEDVRARLDVLSELPGTWAAAVRRWRRMTAQARGGSRNAPAPDAADELFAYQTIVGSWPLVGREEGHTDRVASTMRKSIREAKRHTSWLDPDPTYEDAVDAHVRTILADERFTGDVDRFVHVIAVHGAVNSLARTVLKVAAPGVPDVYQGAELWHLRLVDPDNRAPVDFGHRRDALEEIARSFDDDPQQLLQQLLARWTDGRIKLFTTWRAMTARANDPELFADGDYLALRTSGPRARNLIAFARRIGPRWSIAIVPRLSTQLGTGTFPLGDAWERTRVTLPSRAPEVFRDAFSCTDVRTRDRAIDVSDVLRAFPVALLIS